jgi:hypothetical protein
MIRGVTVLEADAAEHLASPESSDVSEHVSPALHFERVPMLAAHETSKSVLAQYEPVVVVHFIELEAVSYVSPAFARAANVDMIAVNVVFILSTG